MNNGTFRARCSDPSWSLDRSGLPVGDVTLDIDQRRAIACVHIFYFDDCSLNGQNAAEGQGNEIGPHGRMRGKDAG